MLRYLYADELATYPKLADAMFRARADQFKTRLGWDVDVNGEGFERDKYDDMNPLYVIWENPDATHGGSMRFLPTTGSVMVNDHFADLLGGGKMSSPVIWECTRFCLSRNADAKVAAALMLGGGEIMQGFQIEHFVGVFDARMERIYRMIGSSPDILGSTGKGRNSISVGLWHFDKSHQSKIARKAGLSTAVSRLWFDRAFGAKRPAELTKAG